jgi:predicted MPP superfamily phosphohydrolase
MMWSQTTLLDGDPVNFLCAALLFAGACLGHLTLMVTSHNWWYGQPLSKKTSDLFHLCHGFLTAVGPVLLWRFVGWDLTRLFDVGTLPLGERAVAAYVAVCWLCAFVLLPLNVLGRFLRRQPAAVVRSESRVLDVTKELGYRPVGHGKQAFLARLPGNEVFQVELAEHTLRLPRLPAAWDGLTVLHLSDVHLRGVPGREYFHFVMDRCATWEPDLVALTGDVVDSWHHHRWVLPILGRLRWRVAALAILGNHDYFFDTSLLLRRLHKLGMHYLGNGWRQLEVRGEPLLVIGHEGPWVKPGPDLTDCPAGPFRLCLSHTPDNIAWARREQIDLMLSGHVHGGQIRFPLVGSMLVPSRYGRRFDCGTFVEGPTVLHVSRGVSGEHPVRYGCKPEVTLLTLRPASLERG